MKTTKRFFIHAFFQANNIRVEGHFVDYDNAEEVQLLELQFKFIPLPKLIQRFIEKTLFSLITDSIENHMEQINPPKLIASNCDPDDPTCHGRS